MADCFEQLPDEQTLAFGRAVCHRLGIDPPIVGAGSMSVDVAPNEEFGAVSVRAYLPSEELLTIMVELADPQ